MTPEEAVEVLLGDSKWVPCSHCIAGDAVTVRPNHCKHCDGSNAEPTHIYEEACRILGLPPPTPWQRDVDNLGRPFRRSPAIYVGSYPKRQSLIIYDGKNGDIEQFAYRDDP